MSSGEPEVMEATQPAGQPAQAIAGCARMKILFVTHTKEYGGLERHVLFMVRRLLRSQHQTSIFNLGPDLYTAHLECDEVDRVGVNSKPEPLSFWGWYREFRNARPDVIVFSAGWAGAFPFGSIAALLAGIPRRISIQQLLTPPPPPVDGTSPLSALRRLVGGRARRLLGMKVTARYFDRTICVSDAVRKSLIKDYGFPATKMITIHNCVSVSTFTPSMTARQSVRTMLGVGSEEFLLVCAARLSAVKRIDILLQAVAQVLSEGLQCKCVIVGDGPLKEQLLQQSREMGLSSYVFFQGFKADIRPYLQSGSAFVLTSRTEGLPLSVLEAMACGLPCIVTDVGGNSEAVAQNVTGLVVAPDSVSAVAAAISYLITHPRECAQMSKAAREKACDEFDIDKIMDAIERVILN